MAKGLRSSVKKANRSKLRARVFAPVEAARTERLHAKLLELAQQPKPETAEKEMDIDLAASKADKEDEYPKDMDIDDGPAAPVSKSKPSKKRSDGRSKKPRRQKARNAIAFPKSRGKGALKPFSESRIRKRR